MPQFNTRELSDRDSMVQRRLLESLREAARHLEKFHADRMWALQKMYYYRDCSRAMAVVAGFEFLAIIYLLIR